MRGSDGYIGMGAGASPPQPLTIGASSGSNLNYFIGTSNVISSGSGIKVSKSIVNDAGAGSGLNLSNTSSTNGTISPMLHFSALSASTTYSTTYAGIWGRKLSNGTDNNWNLGSIEFGTAHSAGIHKRMEINYLGGLITTPQGGGHAVFNEDSNDADFRVESNANTHALFVDGENSRVGINQSAPQGDFHVTGGADSLIFIDGAQSVANSPTTLFTINIPGTANAVFVTLFVHGIASGVAWMGFKQDFVAVKGSVVSTVAGDVVETSGGGTMTLNVSGDNLNVQFNHQSGTAASVNWSAVIQGRPGTIS